MQEHAAAQEAFSSLEHFRRLRFGKGFGEGYDFASRSGKRSLPFQGLWHIARDNASCWKYKRSQEAHGTTTKNRTADVDIADILGVTEANVLMLLIWSWILRLASFGDHNIHKMPASSSFSVALSIGLLVRGRGGLAQMLLYALEKGPKEKNDNYKTAEPWEISAELRDLATWWKRDTRSTYMRFWPSMWSRCLDIDHALFCFCVCACVFFLMDRDEVQVNKNAKRKEASIQPSWGHPWCKNLWSFFFVFGLLFLGIILLCSVVLTSHWLLCINCFTSLVRFTGFYTEYEPHLDRTSSVNRAFIILAKKITFSCGTNVENLQRARWSGSKPNNRVRSILPACGLSYIL